MHLVSFLADVFLVFVSVFVCCRWGVHVKTWMKLSPTILKRQLNFWKAENGWLCGPCWGKEKKLTTSKKRSWLGLWHRLRKKERLSSCSTQKVKTWLIRWISIFISEKVFTSKKKFWLKFLNGFTKIIMKMFNFNQNYFKSSITCCVKPLNWKTSMDVRWSTVVISKKQMSKENTLCFSTRYFSFIIKWIHISKNLVF